MTQVITVRIHGMQKVRAKFGRVGRWPKFTRGAMMEWGKDLENSMHSAVRQARIKSFTGNTGLYGQGIQWRQAKSGDVGGLFIKEYGVQLDRMPRHIVSLKKSRGHLMRWARQAQHDNIKHAAMQIDQGNKKTHGLHVRKHPFIRRGFNRSRPKLRNIIKKHLRRK
jgi:hypothetical protein